MASFTLFPTALGPCGIAWREGAIIATELPAATPAATAARLARRTGGQEDQPPPEVARAVAAVSALLEGERTDLRFIPCDFGEAEPFAVKVWTAARAIPPGQTRTYGALAEALGDKRRAREVGRALGRNPLPIIVPCHRIVGADARLVGFSAPGGVSTKLRMLAIEGAKIGEEPDLFGGLPLALRPKDRAWPPAGQA
jgi:methylated-DNA-[protein]-cysteine S-methyltransferase